MRRLILRFGQLLLTGLWFLSWPFVISKWTLKTINIPKEELRKLRTLCIVGLGFIVLNLVLLESYGLWGFLLGLGESVGWGYMVLGRIAFDEAESIAKRFSLPAITEQRSDADTRER